MAMYGLLLLIFLIFLGLIGFGLRTCKAAQQCDWQVTWVNYIDGFNRLFCQYYHHFKYTPIALPAQGPAIIVSNHLSGLDPFLLITATHRPLRFIVAREEYEHFRAHWLFKAVRCIPVDRSRSPEIALRAALRALQAGEVIALFPQGKITLPHEFPRKLKGGFLWLAQQTQCSIYPVHLSGISGAGHTALALIKPSQARLTTYQPIDYQYKNCLHYLQNLFEQL